MTAQSTSNITASLCEFPFELAQTRRMLERVPFEQKDWKPHAKSATLGQLAAHVANLSGLAQRIIDSDGIDFATNPPKPPAQPSDREELLKAFDERNAKLLESLSALTPEQLASDWSIRNGETVVIGGTREEMLRRMGINHIVHHRGQLSVYLRLLDVPVPGLYGPSADERGT
ncbi:MAG: DinB family protein [Gemmatimonadetes bacterium]|nr:DinB family protein [Gemmatimonadota bacterium]